MKDALNDPIHKIGDLGKKKMVKNKPCYWEFIRTLRNDPSARENFMNQDITTSEEHKVYMEDHEDKFYICLLEDKPAGYIGINSENYISIAVAKDARGKGLGKYMLQYFFEEMKARKLRAIVKITNEASLRLFESCGFVKNYYIFEGE